jgi:hypothetical protein
MNVKEESSKEQLAGGRGPAGAGGCPLLPAAGTLHPGPPKKKTGAPFREPRVRIDRRNYGFVAGGASTAPPPGCGLGAWLNVGPL